MADRYWVGGSGDWFDRTNHWSSASGGSPGAGLPTKLDNVFFDGNSFTATGQTVSVTKSGICLNMDWTGATYAPTFDVSLSVSVISVQGNLTLIAAMTTSGPGSIQTQGTGPGNTITLNGVHLIPALKIQAGTGSYELTDELWLDTRSLYVESGTLITNGHTITCQGIQSTSTSIRSIHLGSSVINCYGSISFVATNLTFDAGTSHLNILAPSIGFPGEGVSFYDVEIHRSGANITASCTFHDLIIASGTSVLFLAGSTQTVSNLLGPGADQSLISIQSTTTGTPFIISAATGTIEVDFWSIQDCTAMGGATFNATNSTDAGGNTGWNFVIQVTGFSEAACTILAESAGNKAAAGGSTTGIIVAAEAQGQAGAVHASEAAVIISITGQGTKQARAPPADATLTVQSQGTGQKIVSFGSESVVNMSAQSSGVSSRVGAGQTTATVSAVGQGVSAKRGTADTGTAVSVAGDGDKGTSGASQTATDVSAQAGGAVIRQGGSGSAVTISSESNGRKTTGGQSESIVLISTSGQGVQVASGSGGSESIVSVTVQSGGTAARRGGAESSMSVASQGTGERVSSKQGGSASIVSVSAQASALSIRQGGSESIVSVSVQGSGQSVTSIQGGSEAAVSIATEGSGHVFIYKEGGSESETSVALESSSLSIKSGSSSCDIAVSCQASGSSVFSGGSDSVILVSFGSDGSKLSYEGSESSVLILVQGNGGTYVPKPVKLYSSRTVARIYAIDSGKALLITQKRIVKISTKQTHSAVLVTAFITARIKGGPAR